MDYAFSSRTARNMQIAPSENNPVIIPPWIKILNAFSQVGKEISV